MIMVIAFCTSSHLHLCIYPFVLFKIWPGQATLMKINGYGVKNLPIYIVGLWFSLPSVYKPSFISILFVLSKIRPRQASIIKLNG